MKSQQYEKLVEQRKSYCFKDPELLNPSNIENGIYDQGLFLNPWARWHGNLNAKILLIGQDWGNKDYFLANKGQDDKRNPTNMNLKLLFKEIGYDIGDPELDQKNLPLYFTNAVLGIKLGTMAQKVKSSWYLDTIELFIKPLIEIIEPKIIIAMGSIPFKTVSKIYDLKIEPLKKLIEKNPITLPDKKLLFVFYHCSGLGIANRKFDLQCQDWSKLKSYIS